MTVTKTLTTKQSLFSLKFYEGKKINAKEQEKVMLVLLLTSSSLFAYLPPQAFKQSRTLLTVCLSENCKHVSYILTFHLSTWNQLLLLKVMQNNLTNPHWVIDSVSSHKDFQDWMISLMMTEKVFCSWA